MRASLVVAATFAVATACSGGSSSSPGNPHSNGADPPSASSVPAEFLPACGHPGAAVKVEHVPVTVRHADCDLTGVTVSYKNHGGAVVGSKPGGVGNSGGFSMTIHKHTLDVTIDSSTGPAGNA